MDGNISGFFNRVVETVGSAQVPIGYGVAVGIGATPIWVQSLTGYFELGAVTFAVLVGATTLYMNILSILEKRDKRKGRRGDSRRSD